MTVRSIRTADRDERTMTTTWDSGWITVIATTDGRWQRFGSSPSYSDAGWWRKGDQWMEWDRDGVDYDDPYMSERLLLSITLRVIADLPGEIGDWAWKHMCPHCHDGADAGDEIGQDCGVCRDERA